jgi:hypothetical protein
MTAPRTCASCLEDVDDAVTHAISAHAMLSELLGERTDTLSLEGLQERLRRVDILADAAYSYVQQIRENLDKIMAAPAEGEAR